MNITDNHIIIGLGGTGGSILRSFRKRIFQAYNDEETLKMPLGFIYVDSSLEMMDPNDPTWKVLGENAQLGKDSQLFIRGASLKSQLDNVDNYPGIKNWIGNKNIWENIVGNIADDGAAAQRRRLGRFLFSCKSPDFLAILQNQVQYVRQKNNDAEISFHIIAGLAGGTGSGSIIDCISQIRKIYKRGDQGPQYKIIAYTLVPEQTPKPGWDKGFYHANGYAALLELNALATGKYNPNDVTGQMDRIDFDNGVVFDGCYLFSNINENGVIVDTKENIPNIVSDFLFQKLSISNGSIAKEQLRRSEANENLQDWFEYDENATNTESKKPVRSYRFLSFGIKRIEIPEEEIVEYFSYSFANQSLLQFKFNNWSDDIGFRDQPKNEDYYSFVNDKTTERNWLLTDEHLTLSLPILSSDKQQNWKPITEDWNAIIPVLKSTAWSNSNDKTTPLNQLASFCEERYEKNFRKVGVSEFYKIKRLAKKDIAKEICEHIERVLFEDWKTGQRSISDVAKLIDVLIAQNEKRLGTLNTKLNSIAEEIDKQIANKNKNSSEWAHTSWLTGDVFGKKKRMFELHGVILQNLYTQKTYHEAYAFAKELLAETLNQLQILSSEILRFAEKVNNFISSTEKSIATRCQDKEITKDTYKEAVVRYYDVQKVKRFTGRLIKDESFQKKQAADIRNSIVERIGDGPTFTKLNERVSDEFLFDTCMRISKEHSVATHNEVITNKKEKIIGVNIIEKLYEQYGNDQNALNDFVRNIVKYSGTYINFDNGELIKKIPNNNSPIIGTNIKIENIVVCIPAVEEKKEFVEKLKAAFKSAISGGKPLHFDEQSEKKNEISIISLANGFPVRVINEVKILKRKYDMVLKQTDEKIARLVLHMEGDGTQYPKIFLPTAEEIAQEKENLVNATLPFLLLAKAMNIIQKQDKSDGTGKQVYGIAQVDEEGLQEGIIVLGDKFIDTVNALDNDISNEILQKVKSNLRTEFLHITKREELKKQLGSDLKEIISPECNNNINGSTYQKFYNAVKKSIEILKN
jgi:hypothetical protein